MLIQGSQMTLSGQEAQDNDFDELQDLAHDNELNEGRFPTEIGVAQRWISNWNWSHLKQQ